MGDEHRGTMEKELAELAETGIRADLQRLESDMCRQFVNATFALVRR